MQKKCNADANAAPTCRAGMSTHVALERAMSTSAGMMRAGGGLRRLGAPGLADSDDDDGDNAMVGKQWSGRGEARNDLD
jgi:hypothetical protein